LNGFANANSGTLEIGKDDIGNVVGISDTESLLNVRYISTMKSIIFFHLDNIKRICKSKNVKRLYTFGSINTDNFTSGSDIDILVEFGEIGVLEYADRYFELTDELEAILGRKVDLITIKSIKNPYFKKEIENTRQLILFTHQACKTSRS